MVDFKQNRTFVLKTIAKSIEICYDIKRIYVRKNVYKIVFRLTSCVLRCNRGKGEIDAGKDSGTDVCL